LDPLLPQVGDGEILARGVDGSEVFHAAFLGAATQIDRDQANTGFLLLPTRFKRIVRATFTSSNSISTTCGVRFSTGRRGITRAEDRAHKHPYIPAG
jgi:hypothetical protein